VSKLLNNFNIIQDGLVEVASTTCADIIEELYNTAKFPTKFTTKCGDFTWRVSDREELVGVTYRGWCRVKTKPVWLLTAVTTV